MMKQPADRASNSEPPSKKKCEDTNRLLLVEKYLKNQEMPKLASPPERQNFLRYAAKFQLFDNVLFYVGSESDQKREVVFDREKHVQILRECHLEPYTGTHLGLCRTQKKLTQSYYWTQMTEDVKNWVLSCSECQKSPKQKKRLKEVPVVSVSEPWELVGIDIVGPFTRTQCGKSYVCLATDLNTKFVVMDPIPDKSPPSVARALLKMVYTYGIPKRFLIDQTKKYVLKLNDGISEMSRVEQAAAATFHRNFSAQDDIAEILIPELIKYSQMGYQDNWDEYLPSIAYAFNTATNTSTNCTPFFLMYGRNPRSLDANENEVVRAEIKSPQKESCTTYIENMTKTHDKIVRNIRISQITPWNKLSNEKRKKTSKNEQDGVIQSGAITLSGQRNERVAAWSQTASEGVGLKESQPRYLVSGFEGSTNHSSLKRSRTLYKNNNNREHQNSSSEGSARTFSQSVYNIEHHTNKNSTSSNCRTPSPDTYKPDHNQQVHHHCVIGGDRERYNEHEKTTQYDNDVSGEVNHTHGT